MTEKSGNRLTQYSDLIVDRLSANLDRFRKEWENSFPVKHFHVPQLLPEELAKEISDTFPPIAQLSRLNSLRERKSIGIDMDQYDPLICDITFAFQDRRVLDLVAKITGISELHPDAKLYNSGISEMQEGDYLHPHIDNASNPFLKEYRRVNALYYISNGWKPEWGGNLELWDAKRQNRKVIPYAFNDLVFMNTNRYSFHSVDPIHGAEGDIRKCVSNYYFSPQSPEAKEYFHVTTFRARPEQPLRDMILRFDGALRNLLRKFKPRKPEEITHVYKTHSGETSEHDHD